MRIYAAGPLFTAGELAFNAALAAALRERGHEVFLPQEIEQQDLGDPGRIFDGDVEGINWSEAVVACMDQADPDSGTCWEVGYTYGLIVQSRRFIVLYRTDLRSEAGALGPYNLMMHQSADKVLDCRGFTVEQIANAIDVVLRELEVDVIK